MKSKRPFLLVEVLIALTLVALCAYPLLNPHYALATRKAESLRQLQWELWAEECFCQVQQKLYDGEIDWNKLIHVNTSAPKVRDTLTEPCQASYTVSVEKMHSKGTKKYFRLFDIAITFEEKGSPTYHYLLYGERLGPGS